MQWRGRRFPLSFLFSLLFLPSLSRERITARASTFARRQHGMRIIPRGGPRAQLVARAQITPYV
jgi:hypothetical protein